MTQAGATAEEYPAKIGWGHSTVEYAVRLSNKAAVKRLALTHHDPSRDDDALDRLLASAKAKDLLRSHDRPVTRPLTKANH
jgi:ribonuclease BN (tRNA processing enzyme)